MKIRNGFVSNSSSSSFIVKADTSMIECENCKKILKSLFEMHEARDFVVNVYGFNTWEDYIEEAKECSYYSDNLLAKAVEEDAYIFYANVEYGEEGPYNKLLKVLRLEYQEDC